MTLDLNDLHAIRPKYFVNKEASMNFPYLTKNMFLINNDLIPEVHPLAVPIIPVHLNHFANIKIP